MDHLERWLGHYPREQVRVVASEHLMEQPAQVLREVLDVLKLSPWRPFRFEVHNKGQYRARIDPATRAWLAREFAATVERLFRLFSTSARAAAPVSACAEET